MFSMNRLTQDQRIALVRCLVEGSSLRATSRMTGVALNTVMKFVLEMGDACGRFHDRRVRGLAACERVQADEVWCFVSKKDKHVEDHERGDPDKGSAWTWTALCADTKLMISWHCGSRSPACAREFMLDLAGRVTKKIQLTTDGHAAYLSAVPEAFGGYIDYAMLIKHYAGPTAEEARRYSPCECTGTEKRPIMGRPIKEDVSTSYVERANLTLRMSNRRFTRLTNAFSKRLRNLKASLDLGYTYYNWCRVHQTTRVTPAMEAGLTDHVWTVAELVGILEAEERAAIGTPANKRGPYRPRVSN